MNKLPRKPSLIHYHLNVLSDISFCHRIEHLPVLVSSYVWISCWNPSACRFLLDIYYCRIIEHATCVKDKKNNNSEVKALAPFFRISKQLITITYKENRPSKREGMNHDVARLLLFYLKPTYFLHTETKTPRKFCTMYSIKFWKLFKW